MIVTVIMMIVVIVMIVIIAIEITITITIISSASVLTLSPKTRTMLNAPNIKSVCLSIHQSGKAIWKWAMDERSPFDESDLAEDWGRRTGVGRASDYALCDYLGCYE